MGFNMILTSGLLEAHAPFDCVASISYSCVKLLANPPSSPTLLFALVTCNYRQINTILQTIYSISPALGITYASIFA